MIEAFHGPPMAGRREIRPGLKKHQKVKIRSQEKPLPFKKWLEEVSFKELLRRRSS